MNPNDIATRQDIFLLQEKINNLIEVIKQLQSTAPVSTQEVYLTSREVTETYKISKSHLSDLRIEGKIPFTDKFGILLYPQSQIEGILKDGGAKR